MEGKTIICRHCNAKIDSSWAKRNCSNCFSCTGCERYICPQCDKGIVVKDVKKPSFR